MAVWVGCSSSTADRRPTEPTPSTTARLPACTSSSGEEILAEVQRAYFGPFRVSVMLDCNGCNTTAATTIARLRKARDLADHRPAGAAVAQRLGLDVRELADRSELEATLDGAAIVLSAGPAGLQVLPREVWAEHPTIELLADYNAAEPLGIEGTEATDDIAERDGKLALGALAIGDPKMKVHKACVRRVFESNDQVLDIGAVYAVAKELV
jgi:methylenetetrahydrofolate/methylenetetrahydromethanopterin dehydrogenase (NADP+)